MTLLLANDGVSEDVIPEPRFDAPWTQLLSGMTGFVIATILVIIVAAMAIGILTWLAGKLGMGGRAQESGLGAFLWGGLAAVAIGVSASAIAYGTELGPEWMNFEGEWHYVD